MNDSIADMTEIDDLLIIIGRILVFVRVDIKDECHVPLLNCLQKHLASVMCHEPIVLDQVKSELLRFVGPDHANITLFRSSLQVDGNRCKSHNPQRHYEEVICLLQNMLAESVSAMISKQYALAYDIIDAIHCLPEAWLSDRWNPKGYWQCYLQPVLRKWSCLKTNTLVGLGFR